MTHRFLKLHRFILSAKYGVSLIAFSLLLSSCAPIHNQPGSPTGKSLRNSSAPARKANTVSRIRVENKTVKNAVAPTIFGVKVPATLSFSRLTKFLSHKDESLDQAPAPLPDFPTVSEVEEIEESIDSVAIEDEGSLLLLSEAERFAEFSENKSLSEIARGSLNRTMELVAPAKQSTSFQLSHKFIVILALCIGVLAACGYFVISYIVDELRLKNSPRFGSR